MTRRVQRAVLLTLAVILIAPLAAFAAGSAIWSVTEIALTAQRSYTNPFVDADVLCEFNGPNGERIVVRAFYDGGNAWRVRFTPTAVGAWSYQTVAADSRDRGLDGVTGVLQVSAPARNEANPLRLHGGFLRASANGRYLTYSDGTPFFWLGETVWFSPSTLFPFDAFKSLVDTRRSQGFSTIQMAFLGPAEASGFTIGDPLLTGMRNRRFDVDYWQQVDRYITYSTENGIIPILGMAFSSGLDLATLDDWTFLWRYVVARYGADAVSWFIAGEYNKDRITSRVTKVLQIGRFISAEDPYQRAMSVHPGVYSTDRHEAWNEPWYGFIMLQGGHTPPPRVVPAGIYRAAYQFATRKPVIEAESNYEGITAGSILIRAQDVRRAAYNAIQLGAAGYTYGSHGLWYPTQSTTDTTFWRDWGVSPPWSQAMVRPGADQMKVMADVYRSVEWWKLEPREVVIPVGYPSTESLQPRAKGDRDNVLIIYFPEGADPEALVSVRLQSRGQQFTGEWIDPRTGTATRVRFLGSASSTQLALPSRRTNDDWLLVLRNLDPQP